MADGAADGAGSSRMAAQMLAAGVYRGSLEVQGSAERGAGVGYAGRWSAGHGEREGRRCCPQPHTGASLHSQCCVYTKLSPWKREATVNRSVPLSQGAPGDFHSQLTRASLHSLPL